MSDDEDDVPEWAREPDQEEPNPDDAEEMPLAEDNYKRRNGEAKLASLLNDVCGDTVLDASQYTDEWWSKREQELANERAFNVARTERERMRKRADIMAHAEGAAGSRCRFPRWVVDAAQRVTLDTPAMKHSRQFLHAAELWRMAYDARRLGERDDDPPPPDPKSIFILGGGTGAGKSTAAAWIVLKGSDPMPGFIRASELERRGRYDDDLKKWIPERTSLVIDDLGAEVLDGKGVFKSFLDEIFDDFYSSGRRLIITTNLLPCITDAMKAEAAEQKTDPELQFRERYGGRVRSRFVQAGQWAECGNRDLREGSS